MVTMPSEDGEIVWEWEETEVDNLVVGKSSVISNWACHIHPSPWNSIEQRYWLMHETGGESQDIRFLSFFDAVQQANANHRNAVSNYRKSEEQIMAVIGHLLESEDDDEDDDE